MQQRAVRQLPLISSPGLTIIGISDLLLRISLWQGVFPVIILIRKRQLMGFCGILLAALLISLPRWWQGGELSAFSACQQPPVTVVIDPGHGGEDGGAVSKSGVEESGLNLEISLRIRDLLEFAGQETQMVRTADVSVHTEGETIRARKVSDIHHRVDMVNHQERAVLLSIHQNSLPSSPITHGAQVFWNRQEGAEVLAISVQDALNQWINAGNVKHPKPAPTSVYLMKYTTAPGILVECGFLSNPAETDQLQNPAYQTKLAASITAGYLANRAAEEVS